MMRLLAWFALEHDNRVSVKKKRTTIRSGIRENSELTEFSRIQLRWFSFLRST